MPNPVVSSIVLFALATPARAQGVERVSIDLAGGDPDGASVNRSVSADGRYVAFSSDASDLVANDGNGVSDVFIVDRLLGSTTRVSVDLSGGDADGGSNAPALSGDGRFVAFASRANDLVANDLNGMQDIFLRDLQLGITTRISLSSANVEPNGDSYAPWVDLDGDVVAFASEAKNLVPNDTNSFQDIFVRDLTAGTTTRVNVSSAGVEANAKSVRATISYDGLVIAFASTATNLVPNDGNARSDVFVHDRGAGTTVRASINQTGLGGNQDSGDPEICTDGTKVIFDSKATNLVSNDTNNSSDIFLRNLLAGTTTRVSLDQFGGQTNGNSSEASISLDGTIIAFSSSATDLVANDQNGHADIFVVELDRNRTTRVSVAADGSEADADCGRPELCNDGYVVVFESAATTLVPGDGNGLKDVFAHATCEVTMTEFGQGLAGSGGFVPHLSGIGGRCNGDYSVTVTDGRGGAQGFLFVGMADTDIIVFGGHFYIDLTQLIAPLAITLGGASGVAGAGSLTITGDDLLNEPGLVVYCQAAFFDPAAVRRISMTNALEIDVVGH